MKKLFLLPFLFLAFMFTGCQEPDDDVDMPVPEKSVEELIQSIWFNDHISVRNYDYAPYDSLGALLKESKWTYDPNDFVDYRRHYGFDKGVMWERYNGSRQSSTYAIIDSAGANYIKIIYTDYGADEGDEKSFDFFEITAISDEAMTWQRVTRGKLEGENKWRKTVRTVEFINQYKEEF